jgi:hypothetical protein
MLLCALVTLVGPHAMISYKPRQARKGATVVADSCAAVWLARAASNHPSMHVDAADQDFPTWQHFDEDTR